MVEWTEGRGDGPVVDDGERGTGGSTTERRGDGKGSEDPLGGQGETPGRSNGPVYPGAPTRSAQ